MHRLLLSLLPLFLLFGCSNSVSENTTVDKSNLVREEKLINTVVGTVSYREKMALTPDAVINIKLLDVSLADVPAITLGELTIDNPGNVPVSFSIDYDPTSIDKRHSYAVRAEIHDRGQLLFTTDKSYPIITQNAGNKVDLVLVRVSSKKS
jgi:putative lipoprotein